MTEWLGHGVSVLVIALLVGWLIISIAAQLPGLPLIDSLKANDVFAVIPAWSFFAPNPGVSDFEVLYRDRLHDGDFTAWRLLQHTKQAGHRWFHPLWNPEKRAEKLVIDACGELVQVLAAKGLGNQLYVSVPYLLLLERVSSSPRSALSASTQFGIAVSYGYDSAAEPDILFISGLHAL